MGRIPGLRAAPRSILTFERGAGCDDLMGYFPVSSLTVLLIYDICHGLSVLALKCHTSQKAAAISALSVSLYMRGAYFYRKNSTEDVFFSSMSPIGSLGKLTWCSKRWLEAAGGSGLGC